jgi:hypothetical protein
MPSSSNTQAEGTLVVIADGAGEAHIAPLSPSGHSVEQVMG